MYDYSFLTGTTPLTEQLYTRHEEPRYPSPSLSLSSCSHQTPSPSPGIIPRPTLYTILRNNLLVHVAVVTGAILALAGVKPCSGVVRAGIVRLALD